MKTITEWFNEYGESHRHPTNILIHKFAVPLIMWTVLGFFWAIPRPEVFSSVPFLNWATILSVFILIYYAMLSVKIALGMGIEVVVMVVVLNFLDHNSVAPIWLISLVVFILAWVAQFIGHKIEGKKPSFFKDLQFLLIGPLWTLNFFYKKLGIQVTN